MDEKLLKKYIAIKPKGFPYYLWFKTDDVIQDLGCFIGKDGWGLGGAATSIKCTASEIESYIYSDKLQYQ